MMGLMGEKRVEMLSALIPLMEVMQPKVSLICWGEERKGKRMVKKRMRVWLLKRSIEDIERE